MPITVIPPIAALLRSVDQSLQPLEEQELSFELEALLPGGFKLEDDERRGCYAEILGLRFATSGAGDSPWGIYFWPLSSWVLEDGSQGYQPDARYADPEIIAYWLRRADEVVHPSLRARYLDLGREIGRLWNKTHPAEAPTAPDRALDLATIEAYLDVVQRGIAKDAHQSWRCLDRALSLAIYFKDERLIGRAKDAALDYSRARMVSGSTEAWWRADEVIWTRLARRLTEPEREEVVGWLEHALRLHTDPADTDRFDPHHALDASASIERWCGSAKKEARSKAAVLAAGAAFELAAKQAPPLTAIAWLEDLSIRYRNIGVLDDVRRVDASIRGLADAAQRSMKTASATIELKSEDVEAWLEQLTEGTLDVALRRIAVNMLTREDKLQELIQLGAKSAPITALTKITLMGRDGFTAATIGSVDEDMPGRVIHQAATIIGSCAPLLHMALERARTRLGLELGSLMHYLTGSPFFPESCRSLLEVGLTAWLAEDHVKAIHVLVPQVEAALREVLIALGESPVVPNHEAGGFKSIGMGGILSTEAFKTRFDATVRLHLSALYTTPKGLNLRNKLAHGMAGPEMLSRGMANWVVHTLILLGAMGKAAPPATASAAETPAS